MKIGEERGRGRRRRAAEREIRGGIQLLNDRGIMAAVEPEPDIVSSNTNLERLQLLEERGTSERCAE